MLGRALPAHRLRRGARGPGDGGLREHHHRLQLLQGAVAGRGADRVRGREPADRSVGELMGGLIMANRILGFVNAPALMQRVVARLQGVTVDVTPYKRNRDVLYETLTKAGFTVHKPEGAFYLFPQSPIDDDVAFCRELQERWSWWCRAAASACRGTSAWPTAWRPTVVDCALPAFREIGAKYFG